MVSTVDCTRTVLQQTGKTRNLNTCGFFLPCSVCGFCHYIFPPVSSFKPLPNKIVHVWSRRLKLCYVYLVLFIPDLEKNPHQTTPTLLIKAVYPGLSVSYYEVCCYAQLVLLKTEIKIPIWDRSEGTLGNITGFLANYRTSLNNRSGRIKSFKSIEVEWFSVMVICLLLLACLCYCLVLELLYHFRDWGR